MDSANISVPSIPSPKPQRPAGVAAAAIVLGLMACFGLLNSFFMVLGAVLVRPQRTPGGPMIEGIDIAMALFVLAISIFCGFIVVGLIRMRRWARISILILGGVVAAFALLQVAVACLLAFTVHLTTGSPSHVSPDIMKLVFLGLAGVELIFIAIGVWWLVYFNLRRVRELFMAGTANALEAAPAGGMWVDPSQKPGRGVTEALLIGLAVLYLLGGVSAVGVAFIQFPTYLFGHIFRGSSAEAILLIFGVINLGMGAGLLRRVKAAWLLAILVNCFGIVSTLFLLLPGSRATLAVYQLELVHHQLELFHHMVGSMAPIPGQGQFLVMQSWMYGVLGVLGTLIALGVIWLLVKARPLFDTKRSV